mmetsp:Transcript_41909/g.77876  ORF Transcript_41909/g.77876 Transcript_41909/m.77876 type:complete len:210 (-) Transcript_41909:642-1271(-)
MHPSNVEKKKAKSASMPGTRLNVGRPGLSCFYHADQVTNFQADSDDVSFRDRPAQAHEASDELVDTQLPTTVSIEHVKERNFARDIDAGLIKHANELWIEQPGPELFSGDVPATSLQDEIHALRPGLQVRRRHRRAQVILRQAKLVDDPLLDFRFYHERRLGNLILLSRKLRAHYILYENCHNQIKHAHRDQHRDEDVCHNEHTTLSFA